MSCERVQTSLQTGNPGRANKIPTAGDQWLMDKYILKFKTTDLHRLRQVVLRVRATPDCVNSGQLLTEQKQIFFSSFDRTILLFFSAIQKQALRKELNSLLDAILPEQKKPEHKLSKLGTLELFLYTGIEQVLEARGMAKVQCYVRSLFINFLQQHYSVALCKCAEFEIANSTHIVAHLDIILTGYKPFSPTAPCFCDECIATRQIQLLNERMTEPGLGLENDLGFIKSWPVNWRHHYDAYLIKAYAVTCREYGFTPVKSNFFTFTSEKEKQASTLSGRAQRALLNDFLILESSYTGLD